MMGAWVQLLDQFNLTIPAHPGFSMPNKALSEHVKALKKGKLKEQKLQAAVAAYQREQESPSLPRKGACTLAKEHGIPKQYKSIMNRYKGIQNARAAQEQQQNLTPAEELTLVSFLEESAEWGLPPTIQQIGQYVNLI